MTSEKVCGYANFETFTIAIEVDNDRGLNERRHRVVAHALKSARPPYGIERDPECAVADALKDWIEDEFIEPATDTTRPFVASLLRAGFSEVDWLELAREWIEDEREFQEAEAIARGDA